MEGLILERRCWRRPRWRLARVPPKGRPPAPVPRLLDRHRLRQLRRQALLHLPVAQRRPCRHRDLVDGPSGRKSSVASPPRSCGALLEQDPAEAAPRRQRDRRPVALAPAQPQLLALQRPRDLDPTGGRGERAVLRALVASSCSTSARVSAAFGLSVTSSPGIARAAVGLQLASASARRLAPRHSAAVQQVVRLGERLQPLASARARLGQRPVARRACGPRCRARPPACS